jgi:hypothetical protein
MASARALSWSLAGLVHVAAEGVIVIGSPQRWGLQLGGVAFNTSSTTSGVGIILAIGLPWPLLYCTPYIQEACLCPSWDLRMGPGAAILAPSAPGIVGPSCRLRLRPGGDSVGSPGMVTGGTRERFMWSDSDGAYPWQ